MCRYNTKPLLEGRNTPYSAYIRACIICTVVLLSLESMQRYLWESLSLTIIIMGSKKYTYMDISCERVFEDSFMFTMQCNQIIEKTHYAGEDHFTLDFSDTTKENDINEHYFIINVILDSLIAYDQRLHSIVPWDGLIIFVFCGLSLKWILL